MESKTILVTGSTDGIGKEIAYELAAMGHEVLMHGKREAFGRSLAESVRKATGNSRVHYFNADLSNPEAVKALTNELKGRFDKLDVLLHNAGVFMAEKIMTSDGFEMTFAVNHLAVFLLTKLLLEMVEEAPEGRIVVTSSMAQSGSIDFNNLNGEKYWDPYHAYAVSKLENVLFTYKLDRILREKESHVTVNCLHPGVISTKLLHAGWGIGGASLQQGAATSVFLATAPEVKNVSGKYFVNKKPQKSVAFSYDRKAQDKLWQISEELTA